MPGHHFTVFSVAGALPPVRPGEHSLVVKPHVLVNLEPVSSPEVMRKPSIHMTSAAVGILKIQCSLANLGSTLGLLFLARLEGVGGHP